MKNFVSLVLALLSLQQGFYLVQSLKCQYCSSQKYDSDCRKGTETKLRKCTIEGEDHCYVEYILNKGSKPLYRRGCAPADWCEQQTDNHGTALKFCNTCQGSKCNNDLIGSNTTSSRLCRSCSSESTESECKKGTVTETEQCEQGEICVMSYVSTSRRDIYKRGCGDRSYCDQEKKVYANSLEKCDTCKYDLCNNEPLPVATT